MARRNFQPYLRYQQNDAWCGPACIQMVLAASGIRRLQKAIAKDASHKWFGATQHEIYAYLSRYFNRIGFKDHTRLAEIRYHLKNKHLVMINWYDDLEPLPKGPNWTEYDYGHYCLFLDYSPKTKKVTLADPDHKRGIWKMDYKEFSKRWYETLDVNGNKWLIRWMLWVDPKSRIK